LNHSDKAYKGDVEIPSILEEFKQVLSVDYSGYLNHCLRVYSYSKILLLVKEHRKMAIASAFHDLAIWTEGNMDYLDSSTLLATDYCEKKNILFLPDEIKYIINNHHKITKISDHIEAEAFRKADLIDLTAGIVRFNLPKSIIQETEKKYPRRHFTKQIFSKIIRHALLNPKSPLPMIKK